MKNLNKSEFTSIEGGTGYPHFGAYPPVLVFFAWLMSGNTPEPDDCTVDDDCN